MLCHPEPHPAVSYALRNAKSRQSYRCYVWWASGFYVIMSGVSSRNVSAGRSVGIQRMPVTGVGALR